MRCDTFVDLDGRHTVVRLTGRLDHTTSATVRHHVREALDTGLPFVVLDAEAVSDIDNAGVGTLCALSRQAEAMGGWLRLEGLQPPVARTVDTAADPGALRFAERVDGALTP